MLLGVAAVLAVFWAVGLMFRMASRLIHLALFAALAFGVMHRWNVMHALRAPLLQRVAPKSLR